jgi:hypothetical protein
VRKERGAQIRSGSSIIARLKGLQLFRIDGPLDHRFRAAMVVATRLGVELSRAAIETRRSSSSPSRKQQEHEANNRKGGMPEHQTAEE